MLFGLQAQRDSSRLIVVPVPWEVTTSYGRGTSRGPQAVLDASAQIDLHDTEFGSAYEQGICMMLPPENLLQLNDRLVNQTLNIGDSIADPEILNRVNPACEKMNTWVYESCKSILTEEKFCAVVGGDHSVSYGCIKAIAEKHADFGILHIDAHADLRQAYQGFQYSHASIMYNVMESEFSPQKLVQVGIRDYCKDEVEYIHANEDRINCYFDIPMKRRLFGGENWGQMCSELVSHLPDKVYVSMDIDGLNPSLCPSTGTPVPGGLDFDQLCYLFFELAKSRRKIVGFDLVEVSPGNNTDWDANVGMRILYKLCGWTLVTNG